MIQVYAHIAYTLLLVGAGSYLGYKYGKRVYDKIEAAAQAAKTVTK